MKKVLIGLVIAVMMTGSGYAQIVLLKSSKTLPTDFHIVCIDGYKFVHASRLEYSSNDTNAIAGALVQHFSIQDGKSLPTQC